MIKPMHLSIAVATKGFVRKEQVAACTNNSTIATFDDATIALYVATSSWLSSSITLLLQLQMTT